MLNGKGLIGDSSTDPLAIHAHNVSTDEVSPFLIPSNQFFFFSIRLPLQS